MCSARWIPRILPLLLFALPLQAAAAQQAQPASHSVPLVIVTSLQTPRSDSVARDLANTITQSIELVAGMTGSLQVETADFLTPTLSLERAVEYYRQVDASEAIYGSVTPESGGSYGIDLEIWSGRAPQAPPRQIRRSLSNLLSSFNVADQLSLDVISAVVGHPLAEGTLLVRNLESLKRYAVYADGRLLGRDRASFRLLTGEHEIIIAKPGLLGDAPIERFRVDIRGNRTAVIAFVPQKAQEGAQLSAALIPRAQTAFGLARVRSRGAGVLFVDGIDRGRIAAGEVRTLFGLRLGTHRIAVRYNDGHLDAVDAMLTPQARVINLAFTYQPRRYLLRLQGPEASRPRALLIDRTEYPLDSPAEYGSAIEAMESLPDLSPLMRRQLAEARSDADRWSRQLSFGRAFAVGSLAGTGVEVGGALAGRSTLIGGGLLTGIAFGVAALVTIPMSVSARNGANADLVAMVREYNTR